MYTPLSFSVKYSFEYLGGMRATISETKGKCVVGVFVSVCVTVSWFTRVLLKIGHT